MHSRVSLKDFGSLCSSSAINIDLSSQMRDTVMKGLKGHISILYKIIQKSTGRKSFFNIELTNGISCTVSKMSYSKDEL